MYYADRRNVFWRIMESVLELPLTSLPYEASVLAAVEEFIPNGF